MSVSAIVCLKLKVFYGCLASISLTCASFYLSALNVFSFGGFVVNSVTENIKIKTLLIAGAYKRSKQSLKINKIQYVLGYNEVVSGFYVL